MIGTRGNAAAALDGDLKMIGNGFTRIVYLADGVVYKRETWRGRHPLPINRAEYLAGEAKRSALPKGVSIPDMTLYDFDGEYVLAMPFVDGQLCGECFCTADEQCEPECLTDAECSLLRDILFDMSFGNIVRTDNNELVLIDLGAEAH